MYEISLSQQNVYWNHPQNVISSDEMHFLSFIFDNILYMFRIGKLFIIRKQSYMQRLVCIMHLYRLAAIVGRMELRVLSSPSKIKLKKCISLVLLL